MTIYLATTIRIKDPEKFREYGEKARPTVATHGGTPVLIGRVSGTLAGSADHHFEAIFRFENRAALEAWYTSDDYQALIPLRDAGADVTFKVLEEFQP